MKIARQFTKAGVDVYSTIKWDTRTSRISHTDGSVVFEMKDAEIPADWTQFATDIVVSKYFRKAGVPQVNADGTPILDEKGKPETGPEKSVRQVVHRLAGCWTTGANSTVTSTVREDAQAFYDEMAYMLLTQMAAPNSPQWFNTGLNFAYGMTGPSQGHWHVNPATGQLEQTKDAYTHPQPTPASSRASMTTWSTKAASWTSGPAKPASSNTARAPAPISPRSAAKMNTSPAAANPPA